MTCIVGIVDGKNVMLGGDSAGVGGYSLTIRADEKVFTRKDASGNTWAFGFTTSFRMGQLIQYDLVLPKIEKGDTRNLHKFMVKKFIPALRKCLGEGGWLHKKDERESGGTFVVGVLGKLFTIYGDYQVGESINQIAAVGCGEDLALGSLFTSEGQPARKRLIIALKAAETFSAGVHRPFKVVQTERKKSNKSSFDR